MRYSADKLSGIDLGRQGENLARTIEIDVSSLLAQWPEAVISLLVKRKHDADPYVANTEVRDGVLYWPITAATTAFTATTFPRICRSRCISTARNSKT